MSQFDLDDVPSNVSDNEHFNHVLDRVVSRRQILKSGAGLSALMFMGGAGLLAGCDSKADPETPAPQPKMLGFDAVASNSLDEISLPPGYSYQVLYRWGDPLFMLSPAWKGDASESGADQALQAGDNHDGMHFFPLTEGNNTEGLLVLNHEYTNYEYLFKPEAGQAYLEPWTLDKVRKAQHAHGISVIHVKKTGSNWAVVVGSPYNRRLHGNSPMVLTGPAAGHSLLSTSSDMTGTVVLGTLNNCANGFTPWGTYLTCEENFNGYFGTSSGVDSRNALMKRYGISAKESGYRWEAHDARFDYVKEPNESNRFGWIVEIDPFDPVSTPKKRTALGRVKHEGATMTLAKDGRVVVYMGDDQANDYIYKFVSEGQYDANSPHTNRNLLDRGQLFVARFNDGASTGDAMGTGEWLLLDKLNNPLLAADAQFADQAEVLIKTRLAADVLGATKMDRPEWIAVHPQTGEIYTTLTNNSGRSSTDDANPRAKNVYGQIIRWREAGGDAAALSFEWDLFVLAGNPTVEANVGTSKAGSANINASNTFNSPDGLAFDSHGRLWIQTDGNFSNAGDYANQGNNQMLVADIKTGEIRRFLVGPAGCEITGISWTPDMSTLFINIQHPGEAGSHPNKPLDTGGLPMDEYLANNPLAFSGWPDKGAGGRPRSATVVIRKDDGGVVGG